MISTLVLKRSDSSLKMHSKETRRKCGLEDSKFRRKYGKSICSESSSFKSSNGGSTPYLQQHLHRCDNGNAERLLEIKQVAIVRYKKSSSGSQSAFQVRIIRYISASLFAQRSWFNKMRHGQKPIQHWARIYARFPVPENSRHTSFVLVPDLSRHIKSQLPMCEQDQAALRIPTPANRGDDDAAVKDHGDHL